jgi:hypothetical protein
VKFTQKVEVENDEAQREDGDCEGRREDGRHRPHQDFLDASRTSRVTGIIVRPPGVEIRNNSKTEKRNTSLRLRRKENGI